MLDSGSPKSMWVLAVIFFIFIVNVYIIIVRRSHRVLGFFNDWILGE